jgi:fatty acid desaturase
MTIEYDSLLKELNEKVKEEGLLEKTPIRGAIEMIVVLSALVLSLFLIGKINPVLNALMMVLVMVRSTYVAHDLIHSQYFSRKLNLKFSLIYGNFILGLSASWWKYAHNTLHHTYSNIFSKDEDIQAIGGAFAGRRNWGSFFHNNQHILYWFLLPVITFSFLQQSVSYCIKKKKIIDLIAVGTHFLIPYYIWTNSSEAILFLVTMYGVYGLMFGLVIMTNHYGCEVIEDDEAKNITWLDLQTRTSRNVKGGSLVHFVYGGLNTQVEHHIFPKAPRFNLLKIAKITKDFCAKNYITYYETSPFQAYREIYKELAGTGAETKIRMYNSRGIPAS